MYLGSEPGVAAARAFANNAFAYPQDIGRRDVQYQEPLTPGTRLGDSGCAVAGVSLGESAGSRSRSKKRGRPRMDGGSKGSGDDISENSLRATDSRTESGSKQGGKRLTGGHVRGGVLGESTAVEVTSGHKESAGLSGDGRGEVATKSPSVNRERHFPRTGMWPRTQVAPSWRDELASCAPSLAIAARSRAMSASIEAGNPPPPPRPRKTLMEWHR